MAMAEPGMVPGLDLPAEERDFFFASTTIEPGKWPDY
jgi:hypothetical protein